MKKNYYAIYLQFELFSIIHMYNALIFYVNTSKCTKNKYINRYSQNKPKKTIAQ